MELQYELNDGVHLVLGAKQGALLDFNTGIVYSVNQQACLVIQHEIKDDPFWISLTSMQLAKQATKNVPADLPSTSFSNRLKFVWFEVVTQNCNERCIHCYCGSMPEIDRKNGNQQQGRLVANSSPPTLPTVARRMGYHDWLAAITDAYSAGCRSCQFIGGEPFLYRGAGGEGLLDLVQHAHITGYSSIEVFTNGLLLNQERVQFLKTLNVKVAVSLYSDDPVVHDSVTRTPGSHAKTLKALQLLKKHGVKTRVETVVLKANQHTVESTLDYRKKSGFSGKSPAPLWPQGRGDDPSLLPDLDYRVRYGLKLQHDFLAFPEKVARNRAGHPCLSGKLAITEYGDVLPCIFSRDQIAGNILECAGLPAVLENERLQSIWKITKDQVMVCRDCEYRYVCFDCRALAGRADHFVDAPYPRCTYNPYEGKWGNGTWQLDENGQPVYDCQYAESIEAIKLSLT